MREVPRNALKKQQGFPVSENDPSSHDSNISSFIGTLNVNNQNNGLPSSGKITHKPRVGGTGVLNLKAKPAYTKKHGTIRDSNKYHTVYNSKKLTQHSETTDNNKCDSHKPQTLVLKDLIVKPTDPKLVSDQMSGILQNSMDSIDKYNKSLNNKRKSNKDVDNNNNDTSSTDNMATREADNSGVWMPLSPAIVLDERKIPENDEDQLEVSDESCFGVIDFSNSGKK